VSLTRCLKKTWRKKKTHGKGNAHRLTAIELAELEKLKKVQLLHQKIEKKMRMNKTF
jgi:hypothetical protein